MKARAGTRLTKVLQAIGIPWASWYRKPVAKDARKRPGPQSPGLPIETIQWVVALALENPWWGYKKIAVLCRRHGGEVTNRQAYRVMKDWGLLRKKRSRKAEAYQAAKLWELLPKAPNDLWQMDVTYIHIPGHGWWYAVTVIDYYSRYLLAAHLTASYSALEATVALTQARAEAERIHGPLTKTPFLVTDNGSSFIAHRFAEFIAGHYAHVRIQYRTPTQLGLLERFHRTLKEEEVYWRIYDSPAQARECLAEFHQRYNERRPHWSLIPEDGGDPLMPHDVYCLGKSIRLPKWQKWAKEAKAKLDRMLIEEEQTPAA